MGCVIFFAVRRHSSTFRHLFGLLSLPHSHFRYQFLTAQWQYFSLPSKTVFSSAGKSLLGFSSGFSSDFRVRRRRRITGNWTVQLRAAEWPTNRFAADKTSWKAEELESFRSLRIRDMHHRRRRRHITYTPRCAHSIAGALSGRAGIEWVSFHGFESWVLPVNYLRAGEVSERLFLPLNEP